jgi:hypothetical protein
MKKIIVALVASFAFIQSVQAIPSNLGQSVTEYSTIIGSDLIFEVIPAGEFIIDIKRITKELVDSGEVIYEIKTLVPSASEGSTVGSLNDIEMKHCHRRHNNVVNENRYRVVLLLTPTSVIGPPTPSVVSITLIANHSTRINSSVEFSN